MLQRFIPRGRYRTPQRPHAAAEPGTVVLRRLDRMSSLPTFSNTGSHAVTTVGRQSLEWRARDAAQAPGTLIRRSECSAPARLSNVMAESLVSIQGGLPNDAQDDLSSIDDTVEWIS